MFQWDSKITTLPGMYFASLIALIPGVIVKGESVCAVWALRYLNLLFNTASLVVAYLIFKQLSKKFGKNESDVQKPVSAVSCSNASNVAGHFSYLKAKHYCVLLTDGLD